MENTIEELKEFVEKHKYSADRYKLVFENQNCKMTYFIAEVIVETIQDMSSRNEYQEKRLEETTDYNRLLREENERIKERCAELEDKAWRYDELNN